MTNISSEENKILYFIFIGRNSLEKLLETFKDEKKLLETINSLEKKGMIKISLREGKIYGVIETTKGYQTVKKAGFEDWNVGNK
ncbi:MAG: hypothetical protein AABW73_02805 [Nanoarchaeota archaeon]